MISLDYNFKSNLLNGEKQEITVTDALNNVLFDSNDMTQNGMSINRTSTGSSNIELGSVIAAEAMFTLDNSEGKFDNVQFEGAEIIPKIVYSQQTTIDGYCNDSETSLIKNITISTLEKSEVQVGTVVYISFPHGNNSFIDEYKNSLYVKIYDKNGERVDDDGTNHSHYWTFTDEEDSSFGENQIVKFVFTTLLWGNCYIPDESELKTYNYYPLGHFFVDEIIRSKDTLTLIALDAMVKFDKPVQGVNYGVTPGTLLSQCCSKCGISYFGTFTSLPNRSYIVNTPTSENVTYRQLLSWCCQILGACGYIDENGKFKPQWYTRVSDYSGQSKLSAVRRFSSTVSDADITITGVSIKSKDNTYTSGNEGYVILIDNNELINESTAQEVANGIGDKINGFTFRPFSASALPMLWLQPLDCTNFTDEKGTYNVAITDWTYTINSRMLLEGKGESQTRKGYASQNVFTPQQTAIIEKLKDSISNIETPEIDIDDRIEATLKLNSAIANGMGLYNTTVNGKKYYHDNPSLADSVYIATVNSGGFAFTSGGWNNGSPVWEYGISSDGEAVMNALTAYRVNSEIINVDSAFIDSLFVNDITLNNVLKSTAKNANNYSKLEIDMQSGTIISRGDDISGLTIDNQAATVIKFWSENGLVNSKSSGFYLDGLLCNKTENGNGYTANINPDGIKLQNKPDDEPLKQVSMSTNGFTFSDDATKNAFISSLGITSTLPNISYGTNRLRIGNIGLEWGSVQISAGYEAVGVTLNFDYSTSNLSFIAMQNRTPYEDVVNIATSLNDYGSTKMLTISRQATDSTTSIVKCNWFCIGQINDS